MIPRRTFNLVVDARDAMPQGGRLVVESRNAAPEEIVQQSGGESRVESRKGEGSVFEVFFPRAQGRPQDPLEKTASGAVARDRGGHVLLVENDSAARRALDEFLRDDGYAVIVAASGAEALRLCEGSAPIGLVRGLREPPSRRGRRNR